MRTVKLILAAMLLLGTYTVSAQDTRRNSREEQVIFSVNMNCHNCEEKIKKNIAYERGVRNLTTDLSKQLVTINYRTDRTDKAKLKKAIEKLGYTCAEVTKQ